MMVINGFYQRSLYLLVTSLFLVSLLASGCAAPSQPSQVSDPSCLTSMQAMTSVGKTACVEFFVGNPSQLKGEAFLNEKADYTKGFQAVILADSLAKFGDPVSQYRSKTIRVSGLIVEYDGHPGIIVKDPSDIIIIK